MKMPCKIILIILSCTILFSLDSCKPEILPNELYEIDIQLSPSQEGMPVEQHNPLPFEIEIKPVGDDLEVQYVKISVEELHTQEEEILFEGVAPSPGSFSPALTYHPVKTGWYTLRVESAKTDLSQPYQREIEFYVQNLVGDALPVRLDMEELDPTQLVVGGEHITELAFEPMAETEGMKLLKSAYIVKDSLPLKEEALLTFFDQLSDDQTRIPVSFSLEKAGTYSLVSSCTDKDGKCLSRNIYTFEIQ